MPLLPSTAYRVGRSPTGLGLFATEPIKKGTKIIRYFGPLLDCNKDEDDGVENKYLFQISKRWTIDGSVRANIARYINHACKPNAESHVSVKKRRVTIRAIKRIEAGEEINYDYGVEYFKSYLKPIGCKCVACEKKRAWKLAAAEAGTGKKKVVKAAKSVSAKSAVAKSVAAKGKAADKKAAAKAKSGAAKSETKKAATKAVKAARPTVAAKPVKARTTAAKAARPAVPTKSVKAVAASHKRPAATARGQKKAAASSAAAGGGIRAAASLGRSGMAGAAGSKRSVAKPARV